MSGRITMTPEELKNKATRYQQSSQEINDILQRLQTLQDQLSSEWEGEAFRQFDNQFIQLKPKVIDFSQLMQQIHDQLVKTADAVADQDQALSRNFGLV